MISNIAPSTMQLLFISLLYIVFVSFDFRAFRCGSPYSDVLFMFFFRTIFPSVNRSFSPAEPKSFKTLSRFLFLPLSKHARCVWCVLCGYYLLKCYQIFKHVNIPAEHTHTSYRSRLTNISEYNTIACRRGCGGKTVSAVMNRTSNQCIYPSISDNCGDQME